MTIRNPIEWATDQFKLAGTAIGSASRAGIAPEEDRAAEAPEVRRIGFDDLKEALARGVDDFAAFRSDVAFLCPLYPVIGLVLARLAFGFGMLPLLFPLASGLRADRPGRGSGSLRDEPPPRAGRDAGWADAFAVVRSPSFGAIVAVRAVARRDLPRLAGRRRRSSTTSTLGPEPPASSAAVRPRRLHYRARAGR